MLDTVRTDSPVPPKKKDQYVKFTEQELFVVRAAARTIGRTAPNWGRRLMLREAARLGFALPESASDIWDSPQQRALIQDGKYEAASPFLLPANGDVQAPDVLEEDEGFSHRAMNS
jgi:hypothetical protein